MREFGLAAAQRLMAQGLASAETRYARPICIAVVDDAGFPLGFLRQDGAPLRSIRISEGKAYSAARMGVTTLAFHQRLLRDQIDVGFFCDARLTALAGGAPLKSAAGTLVGAVGISGLTSAEDQELADSLVVLLAQG
jgi:uncharacterized protein GlcG (DUF336 family)